MKTMPWLCLALAVAGCAGHQPSPRQAQASKQIVLERAGQRPVELSAGDFRAAIDSITFDLPERPPLANPQLRVQLASVSAAVLERTKRYLDWCLREGRPGGDCAEVMDGGSVFPDGARAGFALHVALSGALHEAGKSLRSIRPEQVRAALSLTMLVSAGLVMSPDPFTKILAIALACNLIAYLGVDLYNHVVQGYLEMRRIANGTERFEDLVAIGDWYAKKLGPSIARLTVMLATWGLAKLGGMIMSAAPTGLPGAAAAAANARAAGLPLGQMAAVEGVAVAADGAVTVTLGGAVAMAVGHPAGNAPVDEEPSSEKLDRNMRASGMTRPPETDPHHIVAGGAGPAAEARTILKKFGIGINDPNNGVYLCRNTKTLCGEPGAIHSKLHTKDYYNAVNNRLRLANTREEAIAALRQIARELKDGKFP